MCRVESNSSRKHHVFSQHDNHSLPSERVSFSQGNMTIKLLQKSDFGYYECVARNSVATIVTSTQVG